MSLNPTSTPINLRALALILAGAALSAGVGVVTSVTSGLRMVQQIQTEAEAAIRAASAGAGGAASAGVGGAAGAGEIRAAGAGAIGGPGRAAGRHGRPVVGLRFIDRYGYLTRRPTLTGGEGLGDEARVRVAEAVVAVPGVAGVVWGRRLRHITAQTPQANLQCQSSVEAVLKSRSIRFAEDRAAIDATSGEALDAVARALRPCVGSIIAITGHTDAQGDAGHNLALSAARAMAVRNALAARGLDMAGLRVRGLGAAQPLPGLDPADSANRRIEFSVIAPVSLEPTVVDTPGPG